MLKNDFEEANKLLTTVFLVAIKAYPVFGQAVNYNVYRR